MKTIQISVRDEVAREVQQAAKACHLPVGQYLAEVAEGIVATKRLARADSLQKNGAVPRPPEK
jgi:hypothetical protein